jgi:murein DD-endopeptidase MepM/ murein hydrolase activator NlpD
MKARSARLTPALPFAAISAALMLEGCGRMPGAAPSSPSARYQAQLRQSGLDRTAMGRDWMAAGEAALRRAAAAPTPFRESGVLAASAPRALAWRWTLPRGRRLAIAASFEAEAPAQLFVDVFAAADDGRWRRVAWLEPGRASLVHDVERSGTYAVRIQPELLRGGRFTVAQRTLSSLRFPIAGDAEGPGSPFGAARDAGARTHQGVDIFAPRGTPVVAVARGVARRATNRLGGNVVWLHAPAGPSFYYAHLDRWAIGAFAWVNPGDVLGYVGTTGNARRTPPHLHFGIYEGGAVDPWPFVEPDDAVPATGRGAG